MKNVTKVTIKTSLVKTAILYTDNTSEIKDILLVGKYSLASAKKYFKENKITNSKNVSILSVETTNTIYEVDTIELNNFCNENKISETYSKN